MTPFVLALTVRSVAGDVDLLVDVPVPTRLAQVLPGLIERAGLPAGTVLHLGVGAVEPSWRLGRTPLLAGSILSTAAQNHLTATGAVNLSCVAGPDAGGWVTLDGSPVIVGRHPACDLSLDDPEMSRRHASVEMIANSLEVTDLGSANGFRVDGRGRPRAGPPVVVPAGGLVRMGGSLLRAGLDLEPKLLLTADGTGHLAVARPARVVPAFRFDLPPPVGPAPERSRKPLPLLAAAVGGVAGVVIALVTGLWSFLLLAALGPVMMLTTALSDRFGGRRSHRRESADHRQALVAQELLRGSAVESDRVDAWDRYPDPATLARRAQFCSSRLWERRPGDPDFLRLTIGIGQRPARVNCDDAPSVEEVPITVHLQRIGVLGLAGPARGLLRHLIGQIVALHSPADLQLSVFSEHDDLIRVRDLPHACVNGRIGRLHSGRVDEEVSRLLRSPAGGPITVVVLDDADRWRRAPRMNELLAGAARPGTAGAGLTEDSTAVPPISSPRPRLVVICVAPSAQALPVECTAVATVRAGIVDIAAGQVSGRAEAVGVSPEYLERVVCALAPLLDPDIVSARLPQAVLLSTLLGAQDIPSLTGRWATPTLTALIGVDEAGPLTIDLERDGPHVLIAGTTGSGKSELLQTLIAGLACAAPPQRTAFLLIDYKGGAAFGRLTALPHTTGMVTDLDAELAARALTGLRSEVRRRERLLADHGVGSLAELRQPGADLAPPALIIVVDEFATLAAELPEFLAGLLDVSRRGRSLGLHLVLATQRPAGVLSPAMKSNISIRICLRVTDDADSIDVIDTPEAARLGTETAGRALLRTERSRTTLFQVARVSAAPSNRPAVRRRDDAGSVTSPAGGEGATDHRAPTDLDLIVDAATAAARGSAVSRPPWTPPLPALYDPGAADVVALRDEPAEQRQVAMPEPHGSTMLIGPPGTGRSCGLRRLAWCAAHRGAGLLVIDPAGSLADLAAWPSTRTYLTGEDPSLVQRLVMRLQTDLRTRESSSGHQTLLVVDGWDAVSGPLESMDFGSSATALADLAARGAGVGLRVAISGDLRCQHQRIATCFSTVIRFGVDEGGNVRPSGAGRGWHGSTQIQWAHAPAGTPPPPRSVDPPHGPVVRPLPPQVRLGDLPPASNSAVPLGLGGDDCSVQFVDLSGPGGGILVAGPRRSGVTTTLLVLALGAVEAGIRVVRCHIRPFEPLAGAEDLDLRRGAERLGELLIAHRGPLLLVADDISGAGPEVGRGDWPEVASALLERFITVAGPGQYLVLGSRLDRALRSHRGLVAEVAAMRQGVLLQPDSADGALLDAVLPRPRGAVLPGRGYLIGAGKVVPLQVAAPRSASRGDRSPG